MTRTALRRIVIEEREEPGAVAAHAPGLRRHPIELALLAGCRVLIAADLLILGRVAGAAAAVDRRQLAFEPAAHRIGLRVGLRRALRSRTGRAGRHLRQGMRGGQGDAGQHGARQKPAGEARTGAIGHIRPLKRRRAAINAKARGQGRCNSRFSGQRHVVSGAPVWQ
ncbi:hypothetical protein ACVL91_008882 [Bradyrhizobium elkanii]